MSWSTIGDSLWKGVKVLFHTLLKLALIVIGWFFKSLSTLLEYIGDFFLKLGKN